MDNKIFEMKVSTLGVEATSKQLDMAIGLFRMLREKGAVNSLAVGDSVEFDAKTRGMIRGMVTKINRKSVKVCTLDGVNWKVSPSFLSKVS